MTLYFSNPKLGRRWLTQAIKHISASSRQKNQQRSYFIKFLDIIKFLQNAWYQ